MNSSPSINDALVLRWERWSLGAGCLALVVCVLGALLGSPAQFFRAYLAAYMFCLGVALGGMAILMLSHLTGGAWGYLIRRILEAQMSTLPLLALLFIPLAFGLEHLYLWARPELVATDARLHEQQFYLNKPFFLGRAVIYFVVWLLIGVALNAAFAAAGAHGRSQLALEIHAAKRSRPGAVRHHDPFRGVRLARNAAAELSLDDFPDAGRLQPAFLGSGVCAGGARGTLAPLGGGAPSSRRGY